jgi:hypothetical protein
MSDMFEKLIFVDWIPKNISSTTVIFISDFLFNLIYTIYHGCMVLSIIFGVIGIVKTDKMEEKGKEKWVIIILTLFNLFVFMLSIMAIIIYPLEIYLTQ